MHYVISWNLKCLYILVDFEYAILYNEDIINVYTSDERH